VRPHSGQGAPALTFGGPRPAAGYRVLRVSEPEVLSALPEVVGRIRAAIVEAASESNQLRDE